MSNEAVGWVYKYSPYSGAAFSVHLAIADSANDVNDYEFWMALGRLGKKSRVGRQAVSGIVKTMVDDKMLEVLRQSAGGRNRPSRYRFLMPDVALVWHWSHPDGIPDGTVASDDSRPSETVASRSQTVVQGDTRRTQAEPNKTGSRPVCSACGEDFTDTPALTAHMMDACEILNGGEVVDMRAALRKSGGRG